MRALVAPVMLRRFAMLTVVLNLLDAVFTLSFVQAGLAEEANPLMESALAVSPVLFMLAKLSLVSLGVALLWRMRGHRVAAFGILGAAIVYFLVVAYHLRGVHLVATL